MKKYVIILLSAVAVFSVFVQAETKRRKPNVVLIMADDVSWEAFGSYGGEDYKTPNLDKLASDGIRFSHCYSNPLCTPSRVKIMTGKYNFRNYSFFGWLDPKEKTIGNLMKQAGYKTVIGGKWQLNGLKYPKEFKDHGDATRPYKAGFDEYCLWQLTVLNQKNSGRYWDPCIDVNGKLTTSEDNKGKYGPDIISDYLCDFIDKNKDEPFFVYYPTVLVHSPFVPTPDTFKDADNTSNRNKSRDVIRAEAKKNFAAMMEYMDKIVGKIIDKVDQVGQLENTIILFTADNGTNGAITSQWNGQEIKGGKGTLRDMGNHVPLIAYWKGRTPKGAVFDDLIDFTDFYTTLADVGGVKLGKDDPIDGFSFFAQLQGKRSANPRSWVLNHYQPYWGGANGSFGQFVRDETYKLYSDGRFYNVPRDLQEEKQIKVTKLTKKASKAHEKLQKVLDHCPPAPAEKAEKNTDKRPLYPDTPSLRDLVD